jgi:hypothetical protein
MNRILSIFHSTDAVARGSHPCMISSNNIYNRCGDDYNVYWTLWEDLEFNIVGVGGNMFLK